MRPHLIILKGFNLCSHQTSLINQVLIRYSMNQKIRLLPLTYHDKINLIKYGYFYNLVNPCTGNSSCNYY